MLLVAAVLWVLQNDGAENPMKYIVSQRTFYFYPFNGLLYKVSINEAGDCVPVESFKPTPIPMVLSSIGRVRPLREIGGPIDVYEYRSGRLIPGVVQGGAFIPQLGGTIIAFKDYRIGSRPIYNLPGKFITQKDYEELKVKGRLTEADLKFQELNFTRVSKGQ